MDINWSMWKYVSLFILALAAFLATYLENNFVSNIFGNNAKNRSKGVKFKLFTVHELAEYNGIDRPELYLVILGNVFDVTKGAQHYGPDGTYHVFVGQDATRSFISGKFSKDDISDDVTGVSAKDLKALKYWLDFYKKEYKKIGILIGRYYDNTGKLTPYAKEIKKLIKLAEEQEASDHQSKLDYPPCNVEWDRNKGSKVWCTTKSGGIERDWVGVPRKYYEPGQPDFRCACIKNPVNLANVKEYEHCDSDATACHIQI